MLKMCFFQGEISTILAEGRVAEEKNRQEQKWEGSTRTIEIFFLDPEKESSNNFQPRVYIYFVSVDMCITWVIWWAKTTVR